MFLAKMDMKDDKCSKVGFSCPSVPWMFDIRLKPLPRLVLYYISLCTLLCCGIIDYGRQMMEIIRVIFITSIIGRFDKV